MLEPRCQGCASVSTIVPRVFTVSLLAFALVAAAAVGTASAHVQVRPTEAAPGDPVLWEVIVPGERDEGTTKVELAFPKGVIPFSYERTPGWSRTVRENEDGSARSVVWEGRSASDGFTRFAFLASTPETEGTLSWKALQTYEGGDVVRWIGSSDSEFPAATTRVAKDVATQNAGGESGGGDGGADRGGASSETAAAATGGASAPPTEDEDDDSDVLPIVLGAGGLVTGLLALGVAVSSRRRTAAT